MLNHFNNFNVSDNTFYLYVTCYIVVLFTAIIDGSFPTHLPLEHMQKDLKLSLIMGDQLEQPLPLTASTNELFKHAKRLGYGSHDASAVYIRARF